MMTKEIVPGDGRAAAPRIRRRRVGGAPHDARHREGQSSGEVRAPGGGEGRAPGARRVSRDRGADRRRRVDHRIRAREPHGNRPDRPRRRRSTVRGNAAAAVLDLSRLRRLR